MRAKLASRPRRIWGVGGSQSDDIPLKDPDNEVTLRLGLGKSLLCSPCFRARRVGAFAFLALVHLVRSARIIVDHARVH